MLDNFEYRTLSMCPHSLKASTERKMKTFLKKIILKDDTSNLTKC